ncbi:CRISPR-associated endonuclease Cas3'' [bacterium]|nr:MAG: CRISPR-associated endonuclease Cas3'' [bacterium]
MFFAHSTDRPDKSDWQPLEKHLSNVADMASVFAGKLGVPSLGEICGLLHDLGKYSEEFQDYLKSAGGVLSPGDAKYVDASKRKGKIDHSSAGAQYLWEVLKQKEPPSHLAGQILALCIASHHSGLIDCLSPDGNDAFNSRIGKDKHKTHTDEVIPKLDVSIQDHVNALLSSQDMEKELSQRLEILLKGEKSLKIKQFMLGFLTRFLFSALIDADRLDSAGRKPAGKPEWTLLIEKLEAHLATFKTRNPIDEIRADISAKCLNFAPSAQGLYQLSVPTGGGKTLSSLRFALHHAQYHKMERIIYVVPYTSIIDQNASVARSVFASIEESGRMVVLEHHSNLTPEKDTEQSKILSENWDAPIVYTTAVQFLETLFSDGTRGARRMHQLANAVIIFDEIQTLPIRMVHIFNNAINFLVENCNSTAVFCTATQPLLDKVDPDKGVAKLSACPRIISSEEEDRFRRLNRVTIEDLCKPEKWCADEVAELALKLLGETGSVLIVVNMKKQARKLFQLLNGRAEQVFHLSTSMCPAHRTNVIDAIKKLLDPDNPKPVICISTQLIEAGVDIDFGSVIRYLAGLDSIAQAAGRCNRNGGRPTGKVLIVNPENENLDKLPDIREAKEKAERVLREFKANPELFDSDRQSPAIMNHYYEYYFYGRSHEMAFPVSGKNLGVKTDILSLLSTNEKAVAAYHRAHNELPPFLLHQSFMTAAKEFEVIDSETEGVIVYYGEEGTRIIGELCAASSHQEKRRLLKEAQRYSVNMFPSEIKMLKEKRALIEVWEGSEIFYLGERYYSEQFGASTDEVADLKIYRF